MNTSNLQCSRIQSQQVTNNTQVCEYTQEITGIIIQFS